MVDIFFQTLLTTIADHENFYLFVNDCIGQSPLHYAASYGHEECCEILLDDRLGLPIDQKDKFGHTPFMCAAASSSLGGKRFFI